jgi:hypothetical protein
MTPDELYNAIKEDFYEPTTEIERYMYSEEELRKAIVAAYNKGIKDSAGFVMKYTHWGQDLEDEFLIKPE